MNAYIKDTLIRLPASILQGLASWIGLDTWLAEIPSNLSEKERIRKIASKITEQAEQDTNKLTSLQSKLDKLESGYMLTGQAANMLGQRKKELRYQIEKQRTDNELRAKNRQLASSYLDQASTSATRLGYNDEAAEFANKAEKIIGG